MEIGNLNLARKWRSKNFDQIVGQDLSVKILKNSLYLDRFFPVYLFSGQRGCGKTTTARVFASAVNCEYLDQFRKNPKNQLLPCNQCVSCCAMASGNHPDFIEMDAASHTGVENVRNIVDAAALLPVMGKKKIYLIDEAHMLSKAAFNAFLKILEEPPAGVLFILATTDAEKILDTVRSRCFQLFFGPVKDQSLLTHLQAICAAESIRVDRDALTLIIKETDGSVRDAINLLERVRFANTVITKKTVRELLGHLDDEQIIQLLSAVFHKTPAALIMHFKDMSLGTAAPSFVWQRLMDLLRASIWLKNGVQHDQFSEHALLIEDAIAHCSWVQLNAMLSHMYTHEDMFKRTTAQHSFLEMVLLGFCQKYSNNDSSNNNSSAAPAQVSDTPIEEYVNEDEIDEDDDEDEEEDDDEIEDGEEGAWPSFIQEVVHLQDPLLTSIFKQAQLIAYEKETATVKIAFAKELVFFNDWLNDMRHLWRPILEKYFSHRVLLDSSFTLEKKAAVPTVEQPTLVVPEKTAPEIKPTVNSNKPNGAYSNQYKQKYTSQHQSLGTKVSAHGISALPTATMILRHFPGDLYEIQES